MGNKRLLNAKSIFRGLLFNLSLAFFIVIFIISNIISIIGYYRYSDQVTKMYEDAAYRAATTGIYLVDGNKIDEYIEENKGKKSEGFTDEYKAILNNLQILCDAQDVSMVYVIKLTDEYSSGGEGSGEYTTYYSVFDIFAKEPILPLPSYYDIWPVGTVNDKTQQIKPDDREMYTQIWNGTLDRGSMVQIQEKNSAMFDHITTLMPIKDSTGKVTALMCVQQPMYELRETRASYMMVVGLVTVGLAIFLVVISWLYLKYRITKPLFAIADEAERFAKETTKPTMPLKKKIRNGISEISTLVSSIDEMEDDTLAYINNLETIMAEKQKMGAELQVASLIQSNSIPNTFPAFPERNEFDLYANMTPAKQVGGDFYDYFLIDDDHLLLAIADVSGKGVPAALFMMVTMILINNRAMMGGSAEDIVNFVNERLCSHNEAEMFVTMWLGVVEISTGKVVAVNAGHDDPVIYRNGKEFEITKAKHGLVLGAMGDIKYKSYEFELEKGDKLFLYTDGVPEATRSDNAMFSIEGMIRALNKHPERSTKEIIEGIIKDVNAFIGDAPQFDDMTMLCFEYLGSDKENVGESIELEATDENLEKVNAFVEDVLKDTKHSQKSLNQLEIAIEEVYTNIAHYAYSPEIGKVRVTASLNDKTIKIKFEDEGRAYDPLKRDDPDVSLDAEDRNIGGLGVYMTKKLVDKIYYERKDDKNILIMEKKL